MSDPWGVPGTEAPPQQGPAAPGYPQQPIPAGYVVGYPPPRPKNTVALVGAILSFIPVAGLLVSIVGLVRSRALGGAGRTAGIVGVVLSVVFLAGFAFGVHAIANSTAADPGCVSYERAGQDLYSQITADSRRISAAKATGSTDDMSTAEAAYLQDLETAAADLANAETLAQHANVRAALQKGATNAEDLGYAYTQYLAESNNAAEVESLAQSMVADGASIESLCRNATNG